MICFDLDPINKRIIYILKNSVFMKTNYISIMLLIVMASLCQYASGQTNTFTITSNIKNWTSQRDSSFVMVFNTPNDYYVKYIPIKNGQINYTDTISRSTVYAISGFGNQVFKKVSEDAGIFSQASSVYVIVEPGANIRLEGTLSDFCDIYPYGTEENNNLARISSILMPLLNQSANIELKLAKSKDNPMSDDETEALKQNQINLENSIDEKLKAALLQKPYNLATLYYTVDGLKRGRINLSDVEEILNNTSRTESNKAYYDVLKMRIDASRFEVGKKIFDISDQTVEEDSFSNKSLKGKYYIIDFWGFWCVPCMEGMPALKELKDKYPDKLEILGINQGDKESTWKSTLKSDTTMKWIHIKNGIGVKNYADKLNVTSYPTKILIGPDGTILYRTSGEHENFKAEIEKFLQ